MQAAALLLIFFAVLMACWGFSVIIRSISEWWFFRKYPKSTARRSGRWWSPLVGLIAMGASVYPFLLGLRWAEMDRDVSIGWLYAIALGIGVFGLWIGIAWAIGDRARGRRRCNRCLYDMSGLPGLLCPECGKNFSTEKQLFRSRRNRWAGAVSLFLIMICGFVFTRVTKVEEHGALMLAPTPVLMAGWRWLPAPVIYSWDHDAIDGSLEERLKHIDGLDWPARIRIADRLLTRMRRSESNRWNRRLSSLVHACLDYRSLDDLEPGVAEQIAALGQKYAGLYDQIGVELTLAATADPRTRTSERKLEIVDHWYDLWKHPYLQLQRLIDASTTLSMGEERATGLNRTIARRAFLPRTKLMLQAAHAHLVLQSGTAANELLSEAALDSGFISDHLAYLIPSQPLASEREVTHTTLYSAMAIAAAPAEARQTLLDRMSQPIPPADPQYPATIYLAITLWVRGTLHYGPVPESFRDDTLQAAIEYGLMDDRIPFAAISRFDNQSVRSYAQTAILNLDPDGSIAMPLLREWVLSGDFSKHYPFWSAKGTESSIANWLEHLADLATHPDPQVRRWMSESLPVITGTPYDSRVDTILNTLAEDADPETSNNARDMLELRQRQPSSP